MARVRVTSTLGDLASDLTSIAKKSATQLPNVVARNVQVATTYNQNVAKRRSGKHGLNYYKRISGEMLTPLSGEIGPHDGGTPVGAGFRHGRNTDNAKTADFIGPKLAADVRKKLDKWFW